MPFLRQLHKVFLKQKNTDMKINVNLFKNNRKQHDNHPDYRGDGKDADGNPYRISAWAKKTRTGDTYLSCSIEPDTYHRDNTASQPDPTRSTPHHAKMAGTGSDDMPF